MRKCSYCDSLIVMGGVGRGKLRFCNQQHERAAYYLERAEAISSDVIDGHVRAMHESPCPRCGGPGPVDVFLSYRVWSAVFVTAWSTREHVCCRSCSVRSQLADTLFSMVLGWWGFPFGLIAAPAQIMRNLWALAFPPDPKQPTERLRRRVSITLAQVGGSRSRGQTAERSAPAP